MILIAVTACRPRETFVEVTRLVQTSEFVDVEVTRIVPVTRVEEATRLVSEEVTIEVTRPPLGSEIRPVQLLFSPVAEPAVISTRGAPMAQYLARRTGQEFQIGILDSDEAIIELLCSAPGDVVAFLPATAYVLAHQRCQAQPGAVAIQAGDLTGQTGMIVTRTDSGIDELQDLEGKSWAVSDTSSLAHFHYFEALFEDENFDAGEIIEVQGDSSAMLSVFSGEADFASASFLPPIMPFEERLWEHGVDSPDPSRFLGIPPVRSPLGYLLVNGEPQEGGYRLRDARSRVFDVEPEIYDQTQILMVGAQLPNETVVFGRDFPLGLSRDIMTYLQTFVASRQCGASICSSDFYGWTGLEPANDEMFEPIRTIQEALDISDAEMLELAN